MGVAAFAPAKINLYLHVIGRRTDGYHLLDSLVAFADIGDRVEAVSAAALSLRVAGPEAAALESAPDDNLVLRAARLLARHAGIDAPGAALGLTKNIPVAAGLGGGSSDAAAALRALCRLWRLTIDETTLARLGVELGADVPVCLGGRAAWVGGAGEQVEPVAGLPPASIVLANPRRPLPTAAVFRARNGPFGAAGRFAAMPRTVSGLASALASRRNDLTAAATALVPEIAAVVAALERLPGALLARMSGSGASCFALFGDRAAAESGRAALAAAAPQWWCAAGGFVAETSLSR